MLNSFVGQCQISATTRMAARADALRQQGKSIIDLTVGEPDFHPPREISRKLGEFLENNKIGYSANKGLISLRNKVADSIRKESGVDYSHDEIMITHGAKQAVSNAIRALVSPGDEVLIPAPYYPSYPQMVTLAGGRPIFFNTIIDGKTRIDAAELESLITDETRCLILNYPSNPAGQIYTKDQLQIFADLAEKYDLSVISDEIYSRIRYDEKAHISFSSLSADARHRTVLVNGFSKCLAMTGWRVGYSAAPLHITQAMDVIQNQTTGNVSVVSQKAVEIAIEEQKELTGTMQEEWRHRRDTICTLFDENKIEYVRPEGAIYIFFKFPFSADQVLEKAAVACVPGEGFGMPGYLRIALTASVVDLIRATAKLSGLLKN